MGNDTDATRRLSFYVDNEVAVKMRVLATLEDETMSEWLREAVTAKIEADAPPHFETVVEAYRERLADSADDDIEADDLVDQLDEDCDGEDNDD